VSRTALAIRHVAFEDLGILGPLEGASRLAQTPGFPNQAFAIGKQILGLQFHLETAHTQIERWLIGHAHELATHRLDPGKLRHEAGKFGPRLALVAGQVFGAWLDQL
jgi:GMP synthase (glutamine-hydrolysing)